MRMTSAGVSALALVAVIFATAGPVGAQNVRAIPNPDPMHELEQLEVTDGFEINLFAAEPMIGKPVRMAWDERGRLWVVGTTTYPQPEPGEVPNDKVYVLEDRDGDGRADTSIVFAEGLQMPTGIAIGDGGLYVGNANELLYLKDTDGDGRADEKRVIFRGFGRADTHHLINTFRWGPDGALYINQGIYTYSNIETPWGMRRLHGGGIWRMEPAARRLEVFTRGMVNPWGHEFDAWGQSFGTDGADYQGIYYLFPGAQYNAALGAERMLTGLNEDHPKYAGLDVLSGRHLPDSLQGHFVTNDYRANRVVRFAVSEDGSGFRAEPAGPLVWSRHVAFRPVDVRMGPDGAIYLADWYNPIIQHGEIDFRDPRRDQERGRIWRITARGRPPVEPPDLAAAGAMELLEALRLPELWTRRQARRLIREMDGDEVEAAVASWVARLDGDDPDRERLLMEALWAMQAVDRVDGALLERLLQAEDSRARAAAVRVLSHWIDRIERSAELLADAVRDEHPRVRMEAVTALRRLRTAEAARLALQVLDAPMDRFLDHALWITMRDLEPVWLSQVKESPDFFGDTAKLAFALKVSTKPYAVAHLAQMFDHGDVPDDYRAEVLDRIAQYGSASDLQVLFEHTLRDERGAIDLLAALERAARRGERRSSSGSVIEAPQAGENERPAGHPADGLERIAALLTHEDDAVAASSARLIGWWGLAAFRDDLIAMAQAPGTSERLREAAVDALASMGDSVSTAALVEMTASDRPLDLRLLAAAALSSIDLAAAATATVELLQDDSLSDDAERVYRSLFSHSDGAGALLAALGTRGIEESAARKGLEVIRSMGPRWRESTEGADALYAALEAIGGPLPPPRIPQNPSGEQLHRLELDVKAEGDPSRGELVYRRPELACQTCHAIGGAGGRAGPDLSSLGASAPVDYIIEAVLMPEKAVKDGFGLVNVTRTDGTVASGLLMRESEAEVVLRDLADEEVTIPKNQIRTRAVVPGSLMPPGLTANLDEDEFLDLIRFLSELGAAEGVTPEPGWIRRWRMATANEEIAVGTAAELAAGGDDRLTWQPAYSMVSGALPLDDIPLIQMPDGRRVSLVRFELDVRKAGTVALDMGIPDGLSLWMKGAPIPSGGSTVSIDLQEGTHSFSLLIDREARMAPIGVRIVDLSSADVHPVGGK